MEDNTKSVHIGEPHGKPGDPVIQPIYQSANYIYEEGVPKYIRMNNTPNHETLHRKLAALEEGEDAIVSGSGMAAITTALLALIPSGGEVLSQVSLYGGTAHFFHDYFANFGRKIRFFTEKDDLESLVRPETKGIYVESISNPLLQIPDFQKVVAVAKKHGLVSFIDNTMLSPVNFKPLSMGFDISLHSATKYLNGHSDLVAGAAIGSRESIKKIFYLMSVLGGTLDTHACFLLNRGIKSLSVRIAHQSCSAGEVAAALEDHPRVEKMNYPGLKSHPDHERAKRVFKACGGVFSFEFKGSTAEADQFISRLKLPKVAASLGGVETLITRPVTTSHSYLSKEQLKEQGIKDTLVRVSVGLEDPKDLIQDFLNALKS